MIYLRYMLAELRRRRGRTVLTALGLAVGVGLVIAVGALSTGLDRAQGAVLEPLTGVGTDISVTRPIATSGDGGFAQLTDSEREQLRKELGGGVRLDFEKLTPGSTFTRTTFASTQLSVPAKTVDTLASLDGADAAVGALTLNLTTIKGTVPTIEERQQGPRFGGGGGRPARLAGGAADFVSTSVTGVVETRSDLGPITAEQLTAGRWFSHGDAREAILSASYAKSKGYAIGERVAIKGAKYEVVGIVSAPLGGQASDVYLKLSQLQKAADRGGRVNTIYVRAASVGDVDAVAARIEATVSGASVTTAKTIADRVSGSLTSARNLTSKLGLALEAVALLGSILIASLLTLMSVGKRVRELGTLKALGWPKRLVVRQVSGETLLQSLLGAALGIGIGLAATAAITAFGPTLRATVEGAEPAGRFAFGPAAAAAEPASQSTTVALTAPASPQLVLLAVGLAIAGGLVAGAVGSFRAARLRPVEALRHID